jgi:hypothetical protein
MTEHEPHSQSHSHHHPKIGPDVEKQAQEAREKLFHAEAAAWARQQRVSPEEVQALAAAAGLGKGPVSPELSEQLAKTRDQAINATRPEKA